MQFTSVSVLQLFAFGGICYTDQELWRPKVYQGIDDTKNEFPFVVSLEEVHPYLRFCTGSLLTATWTITAGHCLEDDDDDDDNIIIRYSDFTVQLNKTKAKVKVLKTFTAPDGIAENDLGLVLTETVPKNEFVKISAIDYEALIGFPVKYAGFGMRDKNKTPSYVVKKDMYKPLQIGEALVIPCTDRSLSICVAPKCSNKRQDTRRGDSGGPLVFHGKIVGVLAGGPTDEVPISLYTPLSPHLNWIYMTMNKQG